MVDILQARNRNRTDVLSLTTRALLAAAALRAREQVMTRFELASYGLGCHRSDFRTKAFILSHIATDI